MSRTGGIDARGAAAFQEGRKQEAAGNLEAAQRWYYEAADAGHRPAAVTLGILLAADTIAASGYLHNFEIPEATEEWWQRGIRDLDAVSARELGESLDWDPDMVEAEFRLRSAFEAGDPMAGYHLAGLLEERGSIGDHDRYRDRCEGWPQEATEVLGDVREWTRRAALALSRRVYVWWYPEWWLRRVLSSGRSPVGVDATAVRAHAYAVARHRAREHWEWPLPGGVLRRMPDGYLRRVLEGAHDGGDVEATYLLGVLGLADDSDDAESWLKSAAEAGHRRAAFQLGMFRSSWDDTGYWLRRAAEMGHPGAILYQAWDLYPTDRRAAEAEYRKAARGGQLEAAARLRALHQAPATPAGDRSQDGRAAELFATWDELSGLAPDPDHCVGFLAKRSGLPQADVARLRRIRNQAAHPADRGWPAAQDLDQALATARALRRHFGLR